MSHAPPSRTDEYRQLAAPTLVWLGDRSAAGAPVRAVWTTLDELERAGDHPGVVDALRTILLDHQPIPRSGRCGACRPCPGAVCGAVGRFPVESGLTHIVSCKDSLAAQTMLAQAWPTPVEVFAVDAAAAIHRCYGHTRSPSNLL